MFTHFTCLLLAEQKQEWNGETGIYAREYHDILQGSDFNIYFKVFSAVLP
jgi:hypothetical protein